MTGKARGKEEEEEEEVYIVTDYESISVINSWVL